MWGEILDELTRSDALKKQSFLKHFDNLNEGAQDDSELDKEELLEVR
jgi:hypothetical protein